MAASNNSQVATNTQEGQLLDRLASGCSNLIAQTRTPTSTLGSVDKEGMDDVSIEPSSVTPTKNPMPALTTDEAPYEKLESKLSDLELDDVALECLLDEPLSGRDCHSRSSKSSSGGEEEKKTGCDTK